MVASSEQRLRPAQRAMLQAGKVEASGKGHAEVTIINFGQNNGMSIQSVGASRLTCGSCKKVLQSSGATPVSPLKSNKEQEF